MKKQITPVLQYGDSHSIANIPRKTYTQSQRVRIMGYLRNADFIQASNFSSKIYDEFTNEPMPASGSMFSDGKWSWRDDLWLYVRDYDVELPQEFVQDVETFYQQGKRPNATPYKGRLTLYENGDDEFAKHYKGRKSNYIWHRGDIRIDMDGVPCNIDIEMSHLAFSLKRRQAFFPVSAYIEDELRQNILYLKETYRLYIDGSIEIDARNSSIPVDVSSQILSILNHENFVDKIDDFIDKENIAIVGLPLFDRDIPNKER